MTTAKRRWTRAPANGAGAHSAHRAQVDDYIGRLQRALVALPGEQLGQVGEMLLIAYRNNKQVFTVGNGGSSSTASHMAADLAKNTIGRNMKRFRVMSLGDNTSIMTALANDLGYESVFSEQLIDSASAGDVLIVISASGNSPNVLKAIHCARLQSAEMIGLLGCGGGAAAALVDIPIVVASWDYGVIEDVHLAINHMLVEYFSRYLAESHPWVTWAARPVTASRRRWSSAPGSGYAARVLRTRGPEDRSSTSPGDRCLPRQIEYLPAQGIDRVVVNAHHRADADRSVRVRLPGPVELTVVTEPRLLGTAGGGAQRTGQLWNVDRSSSSMATSS